MKKLILYFLIVAMFVSVLFSCGKTPENVNSVKNEDGEIVHRSQGSVFDEFFSGSKDMASSDRIEMEAPSAAESVDGEMKYDGTASNGNIQAGTLTAGEWRDNNNYLEFLKLLNENEWFNYMETWKMFPSKRVAVKITNGDLALKNLKVKLLDDNGNILWEAVTDHNGEAYLFYDLDSKDRKSAPAKVTYSSNDMIGEYELEDVLENDIINIDCSSSSQSEKALDLMFMIDTTGSMGDELSYLQAELRDVILRVANEYKDIKIRLSVNFYRDQGDEYTVRYFKFNNDIDDAIQNLCAQYASGGGDYPEAVDEAFENAVNTHQWESDAVKLMFFVLDASPHSDREGSVDKMYDTLKNAAEKGVRVMPVASSGVDKETEYLMRTLAAVSGGTYIFLTNDSGVGGDHIDASVGEYKVEKLNDLLVRVINEYCA